MANEVVGIDIVARLDGFREELAKIPDIGGKEAKQLAAQLSREIKGAERAAKSAADATRAQARAMSTLTKAVTLGPMIEGAKKLAQAFKEGVARAAEMDKLAGGTLQQSLDELKGSASGTADSFLTGLTPALETSVKFLADVAGGANLAMRALFGLSNEQARARAATEEGNKAIERQSDKIEKLKLDLKVSEAGDLFIGVASAQTQQLSADIERAIEVQRRLKGELRFGENLHPTGPPAGGGGGGGGGKPGAGRAVGPLSDDAAKEAEANARRMAAAFDSLRTMSEDLVAQRAGDEAQIRLEQERTLAAINENLAAVVESSAATEDQRLEAIGAAKAAELALEEETAERIRAIRKETAGKELYNIEEVRTARVEGEQDYGSMAGAVLSSLGSAVGAFGDLAVASTEEGTAARKKAMKQAWEAETAMAVLLAAINVPLSISQAAAGPWPAAIGFMVAAGVASAGALAGVIAKAAAGPTFHSGGMADTGLAPDEFRATLRRGEAVLNPAAVQAFGGATAVQAQNRGEGARSQTLVLQMNNRTVDVQNVEAIRRPDGPLASAIRESRPRRVGSARVW